MCPTCRLAVWLICLAYLPMVHAMNCDDHDAPCEQPLNLGKIDSIIIEQNWKLDNPLDTLIRCDALPALTPDDVRNYFEQAGHVDHPAHQNIPVSTCRAIGTMRITDGRKVGWNIGLWRDGYIFWSNPKKSEPVYCSRCQYPFCRPLTVPKPR